MQIPTLKIIGHECVCCGAELKGEPRAIFLRCPILLPEESPQVWKLSHSVPNVAEQLCKRKQCAAFLENSVLPVLHFPDFPGLDCAQYEDSICDRKTIRFVDGPVVEKPCFIKPQTFFSDARSREMRQFFRNENRWLEFFRRIDACGLRAVGAWSGQEEIDAVYHYARLFAQESVKESGIWMPFWYRDARLIGVYRLAYLIKGRMRFYGALMMDTAPRYHTLSWVWLTPRLRRRGIFTAIWRSLEQCHREFKVLAPLSAAMRGFLARENTAESHEIVTETGGPLV